LVVKGATSGDPDQRGIITECAHGRRHAAAMSKPDAVAGKEIGIALDGPSDSPVTLAAIKDCQDRAGIPAKAEVSVELKPWERLLGDIVGIATISRAEHRARQGLAADGPPYVIDAEVFDSPSPRVTPNVQKSARGPSAHPGPAPCVRHHRRGLSCLPGRHREELIKRSSDLFTAILLGRDSSAVKSGHSCAHAQAEKSAATTLRVHGLSVAGSSG